jgi:Peptidase family M41
VNPPPNNDPQGHPPNKNPRIGRREIGAILLPDVSERTRQRIDGDVRRIVGEAHDDAVQLLADHRERFESLAEALFRVETLEGPEAYAAAGLQSARGATPTAGPATVAAS